MIVEYDDDEELSTSHKSPGKHSPLTRDRDGNLGHVVLDDVSDDDLAAYARARPWPDDDLDDDDDDDLYDGRLNEQDVENLIILLTVLVEVVGPRLRDWWRNSGRDSVRAARDRMVARLRRRRPDHATEVEVVEPDPGTMPEITPPDGPTITVDEARDILHNALAAASYAQHQIDRLQRAVIVDNGSSPALADAIRQLGSGNVAETLAMLGQADPVALHEMLVATRPVSLRALALAASPADRGDPEKS